MSSALDSPDIADQILDQLRTHLVGLSWLDVLSEPRKGKKSRERGHPEAFAVSSFVLSVQDQWFLCTAGHVLHDFERRLEAGRQLVKSRLIDIGTRPGGFPAVPFDFGPSQCMYVDDKELGLDYGAVPLRPLYRAQLEQGGVIPLSERAWSDPPKRADAYFMLGYPTTAKSIEIETTAHGGNVRVELNTPLVPLVEAQHVPDCLQTGTSRFYGRVPVVTGNANGRRLEMNDIDGMSGGPIFAVKWGDDRFRYWLVAVQSAWERTSRVLAGCLVHPFAAAIAKRLREIGVDDPE